MPIALPLAIAGAAVVGGGASIIASNKAAKATKQAAQTASDTTLQAARESNALQERIYNQNTATLSPFVAQGGKATSSINALLGLDGDPSAASAAFDTFRNSTGYDFRVGEGQKAVLSGLGARGYLDSGAAQKALLKYGQGVASDEFGKYYGALTGQQGVGLTAASAQAGVGQNYAGAVGANNTGAANVGANAALTAGNAQGNSYLSAANSLNGVLNNGVSAYALNSGLKSSYGASPALTGGLDMNAINASNNSYLSGLNAGFRAPEWGI
jgi:hypothetical protein